MTGQQWWRGAVVYQVYPRSFLDTDGDGVGDLPGIVERLDYIASLGVDAIWVSPFFKSPMADFGYDIADYRDVDPLFGTLADFDQLLAQAHARGLKVMIDQVPSHCSTAHPWFVDALASPPGSPQRARYHFLDGKGERGARTATTRRPTGSCGRTPGPTAVRPTTGCRSSAAWPGPGTRAGASTTCTIS